MSCALSVVTTPPVLRSDWETLARLASRWSVRVPRADLPSSVLWHNRQTESRLVLRHKPRNHRSDFEAQITKLKLPVLRSKPVNCHGDFDIQITKSENLTILVLRLNQETRAPRFHVHVIDHTRCYPTSRSSDHRVPDLCLTIINPLH
jgi:hypothetical protein